MRSKELYERLDNKTFGKTIGSNKCMRKENEGRR